MLKLKFLITVLFIFIILLNGCINIYYGDKPPQNSTSQKSPEDIKKEQLAQLDNAKKAIEQGKNVSISELNDALTNKTCILKNCDIPKFNPLSKSPNISCNFEKVGVSCINVEDCYNWMRKTGATDSDIENTKKDESMVCE